MSQEQTSKEILPLGQIEDTLGIVVQHYPSCTPNYLEKAKDEAPQALSVQDWDEFVTYTCVDCGAYVVMAKSNR